jgi:hypothetical protein
MGTGRLPAGLFGTDRDQEAMESLLRRVNCNDRRNQGDEVTEAVLRARRLAAVTLLGAVL